jgi:hypothetical protein
MKKTTTQFCRISAIVLAAAFVGKPLIGFAQCAYTWYSATCFQLSVNSTVAGTCSGSPQCSTWWNIPSQTRTSYWCGEGWDMQACYDYSYDQQVINYGWKSGTTDCPDTCGDVIEVNHVDPAPHCWDISSYTICGG